jgi:hypothetical protein
MGALAGILFYSSPHPVCSTCSPNLGESRLVLTLAHSSIALPSENNARISKSNRQSTNALTASRILSSECHPEQGLIVLGVC